MSIRSSFRSPHRRRPAAWLGLLLAALLTGGPAVASSQVHAPVRVPPRVPQGVGPARVTATAAVLMDARTGQILYSRNAHLIWPPASTTKIMTALVALQAAPLDTRIEISPQAARFRVGSVVGLPAGARIPLHDLLYGLMLPSGNDVALAIAEGVSGTVAAFVARMNSEAHRLGATQTHFTSPHGLFNADHYTTAYDLALIARVAMQNPTFREIVGTRQWMFRPPVGPSRSLWNHNRLLSRYPGADGVKTGYVHQSGQTLVASATHNGWRLIAVLLHTGDEWGDASRLLAYGFAHFRSVELAHAGEQLAVVDVPGSDRLIAGVVADDVYGVLAPGEQPVRHASLRPHLALPIREGEQVGEVEFYAAGHLVRSAPIIAAQRVMSESELQRLVQWVGRLVTHVSSGAAL